MRVKEGEKNKIIPFKSLFSLEHSFNTNTSVYYTQRLGVSDCAVRQEHQPLHRPVALYDCTILSPFDNGIKTQVVLRTQKYCGVESRRPCPGYSLTDTCETRWWRNLQLHKNECLQPGHPPPPPVLLKICHRAGQLFFLGLEMYERPVLNESVQ